MALGIPLETASRVANDVRVQRRRLGLTRDELAEVSGVSAATIKNVENNEGHRPSWDTMLRLAATFEVEVSALFWPQKAVA